MLEKRMEMEIYVALGPREDLEYNSVNTGVQGVKRQRLEPGLAQA